MSSSSRRVGTEGENRSRDRWQRVWGQVVQRKGGNAPADDLAGTPFPIEVRRRARLDIPAWTRFCRTTHGARWALHVIPRDARSKSAIPEMLLLPIDFAEDLLRFAHSHGYEWSSQ